jgi:hypothetical protein
VFTGLDAHEFERLAALAHDQLAQRRDRAGIDRQLHHAGARGGPGMGKGVHIELLFDRCDTKQLIDAAVKTV